MRRIFRVMLEFVLAVFFIVFMAILAFMWRLGAGELHVNKFIPQIQTVLNTHVPGVNFQINRAMITDGMNDEICKLVLGDVTINNNDGKKIGSIQNIGVAFSWHNLFLLNFLPSTVLINHPSLHLTRYMDGHIGFNTENNDSSTGTSASFDRVAQLLYQAPDAFRALQVRDAWVQFEDKKDPLKIEVQHGNFVLSRRGSALNGAATLDLKAGSFAQNVRGTITYDPRRKTTQFTINTRDVAIRELAALLPQIPSNFMLDTPVTATASVTIDQKFQPLHVRTTLSSKKGRLSFSPFIPQPVSVDDLLLEADYNMLDETITVEKLSAQLGQAHMDAGGKFALKPNDKNLRAVSGRATITNMPVDDLRHYWPIDVAINPRAWIVAHLSKGIVSKATVNVDGMLQNDNTINLYRLDGNLAFDGVTVDYVPPLPPVQMVTGTAHFNDKAFTIAIQKGQMMETRITHGDILISDLMNNSRMDMLLNLDGRVQDIMTAIASKPLEYLQKMHLTPQQFDGALTGKLYLGFPLLNDLLFEQVAMRAAAQIRDTTVKKAVRDIDVRTKLAAVKVDTNGLLLQGAVTLNDAPNRVTWHEYFNHAAPYSTALQLDGRTTPALLSGVHLDTTRIFNGYAISHLDLKQDQQKNILLDVQSNITPAALTIPVIAVQKNHDVVGRASAKMVIAANGATKISQLSMNWPGFNITNAALDVDANGALQNANIQEAQFGTSRASITAGPDGNNATKIAITADTLDLSAYWAEKSSDKNTDIRHYNVTLRAKKLFLDPSIPFSNIIANLGLIGNDIVTMQVNGAVEDGILRANQKQLPNGTRQLTVHATETGKVLQALDLTDTIRGGALTLLAQSTPQAPRTLNGTLTLDNFTVVKAPILARLINAFSLGGLLDLLNNKGLGFDTLQSKIVLVDKSSIALDDGRLSGASLGMGFAGTIDRQTDTIDMRGTLVPLQGINKMAAIIPVLGPVLTGLNGAGVLAATYKLDGPTANPNVSVNPLSALAPGILRSIFFESKKKN